MISSLVLLVWKMPVEIPLPAEGVSRGRSHFFCNSGRSTASQAFSVNDTSYIVIGT